MSVTLDKCLLSLEYESRNNQSYINAFWHIEFNWIISFSDIAQSFPVVMPKKKFVFE